MNTSTFDAHDFFVALDTIIFLLRMFMCKIGYSGGREIIKFFLKKHFRTITSQSRTNLVLNFVINCDFFSTLAIHCENWKMSSDCE